MSSSSGVLAFGPAVIETYVNGSTLVSKMSVADALLVFHPATFVTNILAAIMIYGLPAFPRPMPSPDILPNPASLSLHSSQRADSEMQDSSASPKPAGLSLHSSERTDSPIQDLSPVATRQ